MGAYEVGCTLSPVAVATGCNAPKQVSESSIAKWACHSFIIVLAVRQKVKEILGFLQDDERLREARKAAKQTRDKYVGYSSEQANSKYSE